MIEYDNIKISDEGFRSETIPSMTLRKNQELSCYVMYLFRLSTFSLKEKKFIRHTSVCAVQSSMLIRGCGVYV